MTTPFRLAVAQPPGDLGSPEARLSWLDRTLAQIAGQGGQLVVLPELFACGYNIGDAVSDRAEPRDGPTEQAVARLAAAHGLAVLYGYAERAEDDLYNAALCIGPDGTPLGHYRKLALPPGFEGAHFTPGRGCALFTLGGLRFAILICYDAEFPETVRHVAGLGAEVVLVPTALGTDWGWVARTMIPTRAYENGVYLAYANHAGSENGMDYLGQSVIAAPDGVEAARAGANAGLIYAEIDPARVTSAQARLPYLQDRARLRF